MTDTTLSTLLEHREWVRSIARRLVADENAADDLEQETWISALRRPPADGGSPRAWLGTVVRNWLRRRHRADARRERYETAAPPAGAAGSAATLVARAEAHREVVEAVLALSEPYRSTVLHRYYDGLGPAEIAARTGVPVETVRTRLKRAHARLRPRLDRERLGLLAFGGPLAVKTTTKLAAAAVLLLLVSIAGVIVATRNPAPPAPPPPEAASAPGPLADPDPDAGAVAVAPPSPYEPAAVFGAARVAADDRPAAGAAVRLEAPGRTPLATTVADDGAFRFPEVESLVPWRLTLSGEGFADVVVSGLLLDPGEARCLGVLRLAKAIGVEVVVTVAGGDAAGVVIEVWPMPDLVGPLGFRESAEKFRVLPTAMVRVTTDAKGRARIGGLPPGRYTILARRAGLVPAWTIGTFLDDSGPELRFELREGIALEGRVVRGDGTPARGAAVFYLPEKYGLDVYGRFLYPPAETDAEGRFRLDGLPSGPGSIRVALPGALPVNARTIRLPWAGPLEIVLDGRRVEGSVTEESTGKPLAGVRVQVQASGYWVVEAVSDGTGRYVADTVTDVGYVPVIRATKPGWVQVTPLHLDPPLRLDGPEPARHDVVLRPGATLRGRVTGPDGPLAGAAVAALWADGVDWSRRDVVCDGEGRYEVRGLPETTVAVAARGDGYRQPDFPLDPLGEIRRGNPIHDSVRIPREGEAVLDIVLEKGVPVSGRIVGPDGAAIAGASVHAGGAVARSGEDGSFRMEEVPRYPKLRLWASKEGFLPVYADLTPDGDRPIEGVEVRLRAQPRISGRVTTADGAVPRGATVRIGFERPVGEDGRYDIGTETDAGEVLVRASAPGYGEAWDRIRLTPGSVRYTADFVLVPLGDVRGRVVSGGEPVAGAKVQLDPAGRGLVNTVLMATADRDGRFVIPAAGPEPLRILVEAEGYVRVKREIPLPAEAEVLVEMTPALEVRGVVRTPEGTPLGSISVALSGRKSDSRPGIAAYANSAADGTFRIGGLAAGEYRLSARPPFGSASPLLPVEMEGVTAGATDVVVVMTPGGAISGRVTGEDGRPVALASVSVYRPDGRRLSGTRADGEGAFTIGGLEGGPFRLRASAPDAPRWMGHDFSYGGRYLGAEREGVAAGTDDLAIRLPVGETIAGTVRDRDGRPVGGEWVRAVLLPGQDEAKASMGGYAIQAGRTDADGTFEIAGLAPGRYRLDWSWAPGMNARAAILPLAGGESVAAGSANVRLTAGRPGDVRGTVTDEDGAPVAGVRVEVVPIGAAGGMSGKSGEDGAFVVPGLSGLFPYRLTVEARDYLPATVERVQAGQQGVAVRLSRGLSAAGRLLGADGAPKAKTSVRLTHETGKHQASFRTDEVGRFSVSGLMEGAYRVEVNRGRLVNGSFFADGGALEAGASGVVLRVPD